MKALAHAVLVVVVILALAVALDQIAALKQLTRHLDRHAHRLAPIALAMSAAGWAILLAVFGWGLVARGKPIGGEDARRSMQTSAGRPTLARRFRGRAARVRGTLSPNGTQPSRA